LPAERLPLQHGSARRRNVAVRPPQRAKVLLEMKRIPTAAAWASTVGYCRAVRAGNTIAVAGTASVAADGSIAHPGDAYLQARRCLEIIVAALAELGATPGDVIRTRVYVTDASLWEAAGRAHGEVFGATPPASSMIVAGLVHPDMLVEIEADAIVG
jgi:enamine deaminase RidA (YjgF/YER057c/UK114 family)